MAEQEKGPCPANDNGCPAASPLIPAFGGLPKPLADNLLVRRVSLRPPPMTMNDGDDSHVGNGFPKAGLAAHRALNEPTRLDIGTCHRCEALIWRQAMPKVAFYARYSADNQSVVSIEDQFRICRKHAGRERWQVVDTYHDAAISGASVILRPGVQSLLQDAQRGTFDIVLAEALDRVSRDQADVATLFKHLRFAGVQIVTLAEGEISELHVGLKGTMNALFLKDLAAKTHRGLRGRVEDGKSGGGLCYGYRVVKKFAANGEP